MLSRIILVACFVLSAGGAARGDGPVDFKKLTLTTDFYSEGANVGDFNHDGAMDVAAGSFWYQGPEFRTRHQYWAGEQQPIDPRQYSKCFFVFTDDFNADGWTDILVVGFPGEAAEWYENPHNPREKDSAWPKHLVLDHVDDESPTYAALIAGGGRQLVCIHDGAFGYAARNTLDASRPWQFHAISNKSAAYQRFTHGLGVGDVNGDGRADLLEKDGWWEQPADLSEDPVWLPHPFIFSEPGGAQMFALDVNADGKNDVITSLNAHGYGLAWFEQTTRGGPKAMSDFLKHPIIGAAPQENAQGVAFSQLHALAIADIDGDRLSDIVTGKRYWAHGPEHDPEPNAPAVLYWFGAEKNPAAPGGVEFVAHKIDDDSGVGTQVVVADVNGDGKPDIVVGNKKGVFVFIQQ